MGCCGSFGAQKKYDANAEKKDQAAQLTRMGKTEAQAQNVDFTERMKFLGEVPLFKKLPKDQTPLLAGASTNVEFRPGQTVIREGEEGQDFFCIRAGEATVMVGHKKVATLKSGDYFGEAALLRDEPRTATVVALTTMECLKITRAKFQDLGLNDQLYFTNRKAVGTENGAASGHVVEVQPPTPKSDEQRADMQKALANNSNLKMLNLDKNMLDQMIDIAWLREVKAGTALITQGDLNADYFYVVQDGIFDILVAKKGGGGTKGSGDGKSVGTVSKGGSFGELALLYVVPRAATVKCKKDGSVWVIDRDHFKQVMMKKSNDKIIEHIKYLDRVEILHPLSSEEKQKLSRALVEVHYKEGETIIKQGDAGNAFYILFEGEVKVIKDGEEQAVLEAHVAKQTAQIFGERALLSSEKRAATVKVVSATAKCFALDRGDFDMLLGPLKDVIVSHSKDMIARQPPLKKIPSSSKTEEDGRAAPNKKVTAKLKSKNTSNKLKQTGKLDKLGCSSSTAGDTSTTPSVALLDNPVDQPRAKILFAELTVLGLLGCGGFGAVELVEHKKSGESYALKAVSKGYIVQTGMKESITNEKMILTMTNSRFVIKLFETYNKDQSIYFLLEPALGGELYATYNRKGFHGKEGHAKYYTGGVIFAFQHCHLRHIIYRDLKPENLLLTDTGHIKLTDMGLAKFVVGMTYTTCGTPDYFAPELISSEGHTVAVDWWTLGVLIYELMSGHPPFESDHPMQTYSKVMAGIDKVTFSSKCKGVVEPLIKALLRPDPADRPPMRPGGIKNVMEDAWFKGFDWISLEKGSLEPPYRPTVKSKTDMKNFHARKEDKPPQIHYKDDDTGWDRDFATSL